MAGNLDDIPWPVALLTADGQVRSRNARFEAQWPHVASKEGVHPEDQPGLVRAINDVARGGRPVDLELRFLGEAATWTLMAVSLSADPERDRSAVLLVRGPVTTLATSAVSSATRPMKGVVEEGAGLMGCSGMCRRPA